MRHPASVRASRISGQITYNGKPLTGGTITFYTDGAGNYPLAIGTDGTYEGTGLPSGDLGVSIETDSVKRQMSASSYHDARGHKMEMGPVPAAFQQKQAAQAEFVAIPKKFANPKTSGQSVTLEPGRNTKNFELKD